MQNEETGSQYQTNSFNDNNSGVIYPDGTKFPGDAYFSPWDIWYNRGIDFVKKQPSYIFSNGNDENLSPYTLQVYPYVGLAYYDGANDGTYTDFSPGGMVTFDLTNGNYPTLYTNNNPNGISQEIGALVRMQPLTINPQESFRLEDNLDHLPLGNNITYPQYNLKFDFPGGLSADEENLLRDYGKVFFYEVAVFEGTTFLGNYLLHPNIVTLHNGTGAWRSAETSLGSGVQLQGTVPSLGTTVGLFYYNTLSGSPTVWSPATSTGNVCNSHEVVFRLPPSFSSHQITNGSVLKTLAVGFSQHPFTFWQNSSLDLVIY